MKTKTEIMQIVINTIADVLGLDDNEREKITPQTNLNSQFSMDSLDRAEATILILKNTNIKLTMEQEDALCDNMLYNPTIEAITDFLINSDLGQPQNNLKTIVPTSKNEVQHAQPTSIMHGVQQVLSHQFDKPENEIDMNTHLCDDLGADSLDKYELLFNIEDKFNIKLNSKEINSVLQQIDEKPTVAEIVKAIENQKSKSQENLNQKTK